LNDLAKEKDLSGRAFSIPVDLSTRRGAELLFNEFSKVVANAGVLHYESLETHPDSAMGQVLDVNVRGVFSTIQRFVPCLEKAGHQSRILITGSVTAMRTGNSGRHWHIRLPGIQSSIQSSCTPPW
jgi:NAD(P)-dependent dehydrogenase (short-subunit alcohol dehydrogenase family)